MVESGVNMWKNFLMICLTCKEKGIVSIQFDDDKKELSITCDNCGKEEVQSLSKRIN